jgi:hypothetical protein
MEPIKLQIPYQTMVWLSVMPKKVFYWAVLDAKYKHVDEYFPSNILPEYYFLQGSYLSTNKQYK